MKYIMLTDLFTGKSIALNTEAIQMVSYTNSENSTVVRMQNLSIEVRETQEEILYLIREIEQYD